MIPPRSFSLTEAERHRIERIDQLVLRGAPGVGDLLAGLSDASWTVRRAVVAGLAALGDDAVAPLCAWLRDQRSSERGIAAAVDALSASIGGSATPQVIELLGVTRPEIVADAARILGRRAAVEAGGALARLLDHPDDNVAVASIEALGAIGGTGAVDALIGVLERRSFFRTFPALQVLARAGDPRVVAPLASLLDDDTYRIEAARALGRSGYAQAIRPLCSLLSGAGDAIVRLVALALSDLIARAEWHGATAHVDDVLRQVIGPSVGRFVAALRTADLAECNAVLAVLGRVGDGGVIQELAHLLDDPAARAAAIDAVQRITRRQDEALISALASEDTATRVAVLPVAHTMRAAEAVRALVGDEDAETRAQACEALARIGDTSAVPLLFTALGDSNPRVAHAATAAIQSLGTPQTVELVIAAVRTGSAAVRRHALRIVAYMGFDEAFDAVRIAIADPELRIAELAVGALALMTGPKVDAALAQLARDPREVVRAATMRTIGHRGGHGAAGVLAAGLADDAAWVRYYACQGLGRIADDATTALVVGRLADATPHVRIAAIEALAHLSTPAAWQALSSAIRSADLDERRAALASMALRPRDGALGFLLAASGSSDAATRLIALSGLARYPAPVAVTALATAAAADDPAVREAALSLLAERDDPAAAAALVDLALAADLDHPAHLALSRAGAARVQAIAARLSAADDQVAGVLVAALARMRDELATAALFEALRSGPPAARRAAAGALIGIGAEGARAAVAERARDDQDLEVRRVCAAMAVDLS